MSVIRSAVTGVGSYLPEQVVTNADLAKIVDTSDEWIVERTGIRPRHKARDDQPTSDLAVEASKRALADAGRTAADVDLIIVATTIRSTSAGARPASASARLAASTARSLVGWSSRALCRWRMPVRSTIHSSEVSTIFARSALVTTCSGR